jgi:hypothetical protein
MALVRRSTQVLSLVLLLGGCGTPFNRAVAQIASEGVDQHAIVDARSMAMGDATFADPHNSGSMYWNAALLPFISGGSLTATAAQEKTYYDDLLTTFAVSGAFELEHTWGFGLGMTFHRVSDWGELNPQAGTKFSLLNVDVALSRMILPALSFGVNPTFHYGRGERSQMWAASCNLGLFYFPIAGLSYAVLYRGLGNTIKYPYYADGSMTAIEKETSEKSLQLGVTVRFPSAKLTKVFFMSIAAEKILSTRRTVYKGGCEWWPVKFLALRIGYWIGPDTRAPRYGAGLKFGNFDIDYGIAPGKLEPRTQQFTAAYRL